MDSQQDLPPILSFIPWHRAVRCYSRLYLTVEQSNTPCLSIIDTTRSLPQKHFTLIVHVGSAGLVKQVREQPALSLKPTVLRQCWRSGRELLQCRLVDMFDLAAQNSSIDQLGARLITLGRLSTSVQFDCQFFKKKTVPCLAYCGRCEVMWFNVTITYSKGYSTLLPWTFPVPK